MTSRYLYRSLIPMAGCWDLHPENLPVNDLDEETDDGIAMIAMAQIESTAGISCPVELTWAPVSAVLVFCMCNLLSWHEGSMCALHY